MRGVARGDGRVGAPFLTRPSPKFRGEATPRARRPVRTVFLLSSPGLAWAFIRVRRRGRHFLKHESLLRLKNEALAVLASLEGSGDRYPRLMDRLAPQSRRHRDMLQLRKRLPVQLLDNLVGT
jgi:hypothetical protein